MVNSLLQSIAGKGGEGKSKSSPPLTSQFGGKDLPPVFSSLNRNSLERPKVLLSSEPAHFHSASCNTKNLHNIHVSVTV